MEFGLKLLDEHGFVKNKMISGCFGSRFPGQSRMALPNQQTVEYPSFKPVFVGDGGTGKTTFVKRHLTGEFEKKYEHHTKWVGTFHKKQDFIDVVEGTEKVEGIFINTPSKEEDLNVEEKVEDLNAEAFSKMRNLILLKIGNVCLPQGLTFLSSDLRLMNWPGYPLKSMPKNFNPNKLVELIMPHSRTKQLWEGNWSLEWLRIIDLSDSRELIMTLDFARVPNFEKLILKGYTKLSNIHASLGDLRHLILLDLNGCKCLKSLPCKINMESLEIFFLSSCLKLKKFSEVVENMSCLSELYMDGTAIEDLPLSME